MRSYKLAFPVIASGANLANVTILRGGRIKSVRWAQAVDAPADNAAVSVELSTQGNATEIGTNDTQREIDEIKSLTNGTATSVWGVNVQRFVDFPVVTGEKLFLNATVAGTVSAPTTCFVDIDEGR